MVAETTMHNNRFSLRLPMEWEDKSVSFLEGPAEEEFKHSIVVVAYHDVVPPDLIGYAEAGIHIVEKELQSYEELKRGMLTRLIISCLLTMWSLSRKAGGQVCTFHKKMDFLQDVF